MQYKQKSSEYRSKKAYSKSKKDLTPLPNSKYFISSKHQTKAPLKQDEIQYVPRQQEEEEDSVSTISGKLKSSLREHCAQLRGHIKQRVVLPPANKPTFDHLHVIPAEASLKVFKSYNQFQASVNQTVVDRLSGYDQRELRSELQNQIERTLREMGNLNFYPGVKFLY